MVQQELKIKVTNKLKSVIKNNVIKTKNKTVPNNIKDVIESKKTTNDLFISIEDIKWLQANIVDDLPDVYLHELISDEDIILPEPEIIPRNPILEARIQKLKAQQEERDYRNMTKNVDSVRIRHPEDNIGYQIKQINRQLIAVLQFVFSVAAGFAFGFIGIELIVGDLDFGFRLLLGVICSLIIALAEIYFLAKKLADDLVPPTPVTPTSPTTASKSDEKPHQD